MYDFLIDILPREDINVPEYNQNVKSNQSHHNNHTSSTVSHPIAVDAASHSKIQTSSLILFL